MNPNTTPQNYKNNWMQSPTNRQDSRSYGASHSQHMDKFRPHGFSSPYSNTPNQRRQNNSQYQNNYNSKQRNRNRFQNNHQSGHEKSELNISDYFHHSMLQDPWKHFESVKNMNSSNIKSDPVNEENKDIKPVANVETDDGDIQTETIR